MTASAIFRYLTALTAFCIAASALAQTPAAPSTEQMIEQLKAPRTRGLRNLQVEATPSTPASTPTVATPTPIPAPAAPTTTSAAIAPASPAAQSAATATIAAPAAARPSLSLLIQFDFNSARIKTESQQALSRLAQALKSEDLLASQFSIEGHTDATGRAEYNLKLSRERADAVREILVAQGIASSRLQSTGKGATELANSADPAAAENRRVKIVNLD
jgi:OmpA-OmpF porin, OOP family